MMDFSDLLKPFILMLFLRNFFTEVKKISWARISRVTNVVTFRSRYQADIGSKVAPRIWYCRTPYNLSQLYSHLWGTYDIVYPRMYRCLWIAGSICDSEGAPSMREKGIRPHWNPSCRNKSLRNCGKALKKMFHFCANFKYWSLRHY